MGVWQRLKKRLFLWWAASRADRLAFGTLMALTGIALVSPVVVACLAVVLLFRLPSYVMNTVDVALGLSGRLDWAVDFYAFRERLRQTVACVRQFWRMVWGVTDDG